MSPPAQPPLRSAGISTCLLLRRPSLLGMQHLTLRVPGVPSFLPTVTLTMMVS